MVVLTDGEQHRLDGKHLERLDENVLYSCLERGVGLLDRGVVAGLAGLLPDLLGLLLEDDRDVRLRDRKQDQEKTRASEGEEDPEQVAPAGRAEMGNMSARR